MLQASLTSQAIQKANRRRQYERAKGRRSLVFSHEPLRHRFRAGLPLHVKQDLIPIPADALWHLTREDMQGFASTYIALTAAILVFIL